MDSGFRGGQWFPWDMTESGRLCRKRIIRGQALAVSAFGVGYHVSLLGSAARPGTSCPERKP